MQDGVGPTVQGKREEEGGQGQADSATVSRIHGSYPELPRSASLQSPPRQQPPVEENLTIIFQMQCLG